MKHKKESSQEKSKRTGHRRCQGEEKKLQFFFFFHFLIKNVLVCLEPDTFNCTNHRIIESSTLENRTRVTKKGRGGKRGVLSSTSPYRTHLVEYRNIITSIYHRSFHNQNANQLKKKVKKCFKRACYQCNSFLKVC